MLGALDKRLQRKAHWQRGRTGCRCEQQGLGQLCDGWMIPAVAAWHGDLSVSRGESYVRAQVTQL